MNHVALSGNLYLAIYWFSHVFGCDWATGAFTVIATRDLNVCGSQTNSWHSDKRKNMKWIQT